MSSIASAPATIPPTKETSFGPAFASLSVGTQVLVRQLLHASGLGSITGTRPAADTRFGSAPVSLSASLVLEGTCGWAVLSVSRHLRVRIRWAIV